MVICLEQVASDLHMGDVQLIPLHPIISCSSKIHNALLFLVLAYPGCVLEKRPLNRCSSNSSTDYLLKLQPSAKGDDRNLLSVLNNAVFLDIFILFLSL